MNQGFRRFVACIAFLLLATAFGRGSDFEQPRVRNMPHRNQPIESRLIPGDEVVEMDYWLEPQIVTYPNESREQTVLRMSRQADVIAVIRLTNVESFFAEERSWIRTKVAGIPDEVLKSGTSDQRSFEALVDGGEMRIKGVHVKAGSYPELHPGGRYLVFVKTLGETPWLFHIYSLEDPKAVRRPVWARAVKMPANPFEKRSAAEVLSEVRKAMESK